MKKIISFLLMLAMFSSSVIFVSAAEKVNGDEELRILKSLEIIPEDAVGDDVITRGKLAEILYSLLALDIDTPKTSVFSDVQPTDNNYKYIEGVCQVNAMYGYPDGTFKPEAVASTDEVVTAVLNVLGYKSFANVHGGYPTGYRSLARQYKLYKNLDDSTIAAELTYRSMAIVLINSFELETISVSGFQGGNVEIGSSGDTILQMYRNISRGEGIVDGNDFTSLLGVEEIPDGMVMIDGEVYSAGNIDFDEWIGKRVIFYYQEESRDVLYNTVIAISDDDNYELEINAENIESVTDSNGSIVIRYNDEDSKRSHKATVIKNRYTIYNGAAYNEAVAADFDIKHGIIRLIDNDEDGKYDVAFIEDPKTIIVESINAREKRLIAKYDFLSATDDLREFDSLREINIDPEVYNIRVLKNGVKINIEDISTDDVVSVLASKKTQNKRNITLLVSSESVGGKLERILEEYISVNGADYNLGAWLDSSKVISVGDEALFYIDSYGYVVDFEFAKDTSSGYAFLLKIYEVDEGEFDYNMYRIKMYTAEGSVVTLDTAKNLRVDGVKYTKLTDADGLDIDFIDYMRYAATGAGRSTSITNTFIPAGENSATYKMMYQIIKYTKNINGAINNIDTVLKNQNVKETDLTLQNEFKDRGTEGWNGNLQAFGKSFGTDKDTVVLRIPTAKNGAIDENYIKTTNNSYFEWDWGLSAGSYELYNFDETFVPDLIVMYNQGDSDTQYQDRKVMIVQSISTIINENDEVVTLVEGLMDGVSTSVVSNTELAEEDASHYRKNDFTALNKGDIVQFITDENGYARAYILIYSPFYNNDTNKLNSVICPEKNILTGTFGGSNNDQYLARYGYASAKGDNNFLFTYDRSSLPDFYTFNGINMAGAVYVVDVKTGRAEAGNVADVVKRYSASADNYMIVISYRSNLMSAVIYR